MTTDTYIMHTQYCLSRCSAGST